MRVRAPRPRGAIRPSEGLVWDRADRTGIPGGRPGSGSLKDKTPRFSRGDELLWGRGTELLCPHLCASAADEWARRMDSPECVISSSNCETPPFTNNLSQLYRTHTETKAKPLPCSLPLPSPVRKGFIRARSTGEGASLRGKFPRPLLGLFPLGCPRNARPKDRIPRSGTPRPLSPVSPCSAREARRVLLRQPEQGEPKASQQISSTVLGSGRHEARRG